MRLLAAMGTQFFCKAPEDKVLIVWKITACSVYRAVKEQQQLERHVAFSCMCVPSSYSRMRFFLSDADLLSVALCFSRRRLG